MTPRLIRLHPDRDDFAMYLSGRRGPFGTPLQCRGTLMQVLAWRTEHFPFEATS